ncbi:MAG: NUDIX hydrolase [Spirochaetales bacterium]|nr:NUDIX hydrolase [Spirochaetales bacterium]
MDRESSPFDHLLWKETARTLEARCRIFDVYRVQKASGKGTTGSFYLLDAPEWVTVVPVIQNGDGTRSFVMVRQYRHGSGEVTLEFPAGVVEKGEEPEAAGRRELKEETGYEAAEARLLGRVNPNPAFMNNRTHVFLFSGLTKTALQCFDEHEDIEVELVPEDTAVAQMGTGEFGNGIMMIALGFYLRDRKGKD